MHLLLVPEYESRAIALVNVAIDNHHPFHEAIFLEATDGNRDVVDHAKAFTVIRKRMMKSATNIEGDLVFKGASSCQNRSSSGEPEGVHQFFRVGNFHLEFLLGS